MSEGWSIYIDIEGFGDLWEREDQVLWSLGDLMQGIFRIGTRCYPEPVERLFAHQFGDGFVVGSDFPEESFDRCAAIAIVLMRHVAASSRFARAGIAEGSLSDINGCYPSEVVKSMNAHGTVRMGMGKMTTTPVMGTGLVRAVRVTKQRPNGPLLLANASCRRLLEAGIRTTTIPGSDYLSIDWLRSASEIIALIQSKAGLRAPTAADLSDRLRRYCTEHSPPDTWVNSVHEFLLDS